MKKLSLLLLCLFVQSVLADTFYNYHCGYLRNDEGEYKYLWSSSLLGEHKSPSFGVYQDHGSFIYNGKVAICMMTEGNDKPDSFNIYINFYEGNNVNFAPGLCSFIGANTYLPFGFQTHSLEGSVIAEYHSNDKTFLVFHRSINDPQKFKDDNCFDDLKDYLK